jgi:hypothetical protein
LSNIAANDAEISTNVAGIAANLSNIAANDAEISTNVAGVAANLSNIAANDAEISTNASNIATNDASNIATNDTDIAANAANIASNDADISTNVADISTNVAGIATLNGDANVTGSVDQKIADALTDALNTDDLDAGSEGIAGVIEKRSDGTVKIGENSFVFDDTTASHVLTADGAATEIVLGGDAPGTAGTVESVDVRVANDLYVDGDVFIGGNANGVQAQLDANAVEIATNAAGIATNAAGIATNAAGIATNAAGIASNASNIERNARGIAMVAALTHTTVLPGMTHALDISAAHFEGETGMAVSYSRRVQEGVQINFGAAATTDFDEAVVRGGIGFQW